MAGHLLFNSGSNESSLAPQFKWLDNTFNHYNTAQYLPAERESDTSFSTQAFSGISFPRAPE
jgi:hypothetical protein